MIGPILRTWICLVCGHVNDARNGVCNWCGKPKYFQPPLPDMEDEEEDDG